MAGYLKKEKGYDVQFEYKNDYPNLPGSVAVNGSPIYTPSNINSMLTYLEQRDRAGSPYVSYGDINPIGRVTIDNHETRWKVKRPEGYPRNKYVMVDQPAYSIDMELVKSVLVFGYEPGHRYVTVEVNLLSEQELKQRTKNYRFTTFAGYSKPVEFYAPTYPSGPIKGDKDFRRTIYWNPEVKTDSQGCATIGFYNNGYSRMLSVSAEGLTDGGVPILNVPE